MKKYNYSYEKNALYTLYSYEKNAYQTYYSYEKNAFFINILKNRVFFDIIFLENGEANA